MIGTQHFLLFLIELWLEVPLVHAVEHKSCDILGAQLLRQILSPLLRRQPPVLIAVKLPIAVHILKDFAINLQQLHARVRLQAQFGAALILHQQITVGCLSLRIVRRCCRLYL